jgi:mannose-6-phosphate isomerase
MRSDDHEAVSAQSTSALDDIPLLRALPLPENRVSRFYRGGALLDAFRGSRDAVDGNRPEDWVGSVTRAWRPPGVPPADEGLSVVSLDGRDVPLADVLAGRPSDIAGRGVTDRWGATSGLLVKLLDAAIRLPVHCHPSRGFAERVLGSPFGKAEAWLFLETRQIPDEEPPHIRIGWRREVGRDELRGWIEREDTAALLDAMHRVDVQPGDAWFVPPGTPHAIGAGGFIVELQEPTDFSIVAETRDFPIDPADASLGLGWDTMIDAFDRSGRSPEALAHLRHAPAAPWRIPGGTLRTLLGSETSDYFRALELSLDGNAPWPMPGEFAVVVVTRGSAVLHGVDGSVRVQRGSTVAVPAVAAAALEVRAAENLTAICCLPPGTRLG